MTEAGWTSNRPKVAGWYWFRVAEIATPKPLYVDYGFVNGKQVWYAEGCAGYIHDWPHGEWLGPLSPDSFQQGRVAGLREAVKQLHEGVRLAQSREVADALSGHAYTLDRIAQQAQDEKGVGDGKV